MLDDAGNELFDVIIDDASHVSVLGYACLSCALL